MFKLIKEISEYSRTSLTLTLMARVLCLTRTRSRVAYELIYEPSVVTFLHLCFHAVIIFIFYF